jgi:hypothetical protein
MTAAVIAALFAAPLGRAHRSLPAGQSPTSGSVSVLNGNSTLTCVSDSASVSMSRSSPGKATCMGERSSSHRARR